MQYIIIPCCYNNYILGSDYKEAYETSSWIILRAFDAIQCPSQKLDQGYYQRET